ncbi:Mce-family protein Mce2D [Mycobacterium tuberculosis H37Rv] [Mycobacterium shimoidei]|uniref:Mce-family protein Mce2D [Mycobacterium tuberculosis H37Rv] n=1 Tax=Mycobacterium shimoidei TaxID=29313 RepID=A0A375YTM2_MYCSH|nr:virulence factor Mce family protein [Mycobacterium shimoidei]SRX92264.1 Mce-family protein Mce2D [Mycobacterium tuberculosis H37Rv] [Mycobacterium shimoidei]
MSTVFDVRSIRLPKLSGRAVLAGALAVLFAVAAAVAGAQVYHKLTTTTVVAYFSQALALYPGDKVQIMGVRVGSIDKIEPVGDKMRITLHYNNKYKVPANATASVLNPSLVASRTIQLSPPYDGGPVLADGAVIPIERTQVPVEWDELRDSLSNILRQLGPSEQQPTGPFGELIESAADNLAGKGNQINETLTSLSKALTALNEGRGDFFAITASLAKFVSALYQHDEQFVAVNNNLAQFTDWFTKSDHDVTDAVQRIDDVLGAARKFLDDNGSVLAHDVGNLADATTTLLQPEPRDGLETALHVLPTYAGNFNNIYHPVHGALVAMGVFPNFANPLQAICSAIQAGSRLGYQESAELCAQYLAPVLDAVKFNFLPFGINLWSSASTLPKEVSYSEERLRPPPGYKDTTVPGIFSPDTPFSHRNSEPGWIVAPGMQGTQVQPFTANLLTPESLAELMGGPDIVPPPPGTNLPGSPDAYDEHSPLPPPWYPQPGPPPGPAPGVIPGPPPAQSALPAESASAATGPEQ